MSASGSEAVRWQQVGPGERGLGPSGLVLFRSLGFSNAEEIIRDVGRVKKRER